MSITTNGAIEWFERRAKEAPGKGSREAFLLAVDALRKRTPTPVTHEATIYACHTCPSCKNVVDETTEFVPGAKIFVHSNWCKFCGQALKWEESK